MRFYFVESPDYMKRPVHLVFGAGVSRAIVAGLGLIKAARIQGTYLNVASVGGISAGAVVSLLYAAGVTTERMEELVMSKSLGSLLDRNYRYFHYGRLGWRILTHRHQQSTLPSTGLFNTCRLGEFVEKEVSQWPGNYWTMAYAPREQAQVIFSKQGVYMRFRDGRIEIVDTVAASIGLAIRATCAIPGLFDSVKFVSSKGRTIELFDGFLSWDGYCPASLVENCFGVNKNEIIACDVVRYKTSNRLMERGYLAVLTPDPPFGTCCLNPTSEQKKIGIARAFEEAQETFSRLKSGEISALERSA